MTAILRAGVIGAGVFGGYHAEKYAELVGVVLEGVYDPHPERALAITERCGGRAFADLAELLADVDVVSVASPAVWHARGALAAIEAGRHVYVEKPIATVMADADALVAAAARRGLVAACGFLERAAFQAMGLFDIAEAPVALEATRLGRPSPRNLDVSVALDLMIHDLDLALALARAPPLAVEADGACLANQRFDRIDAEVTFEDGFVAALRASRVAEAPERTMRLVYASGEITVDFLKHTLGNSTPHVLNAGFAETPVVRDRLGASLAAFLAAVRGETPRPLATAADGARALDLALAVEQAVGG